MGQHRTAAPPDHDSDFFAWTQHQAKLLRTLRRWPAAIPAELDLDRVAEEVADLGTAELNAVKSLLRQILIHLIKAASEPESAAVRHWRTEAGSFHADLLDRYAPSMRQLIDLQALWKRARRVAEDALGEHDVTLAPEIPDLCPFLLQDLVAEEFRFDAALERLRGRQSAA